MKIHLLLFFFVISVVSLLHGQSMNYTLFKGKVYKCPNQLKYEKFTEDYESLYPLLNEFSWDSINISQRDTDLGFPDVDRKGAFAIMFSTVLTIDKTSMYRFAITSDDGSIVWLDGEKIIDNDFSDGMHMKADTVALRPGDYAVKIWYYQAYPTMFGVIYESGPVSGDIKFDVDTVSLDQDLLFNVGSSRMIRGSEYLLDSIGQVLLTYEKVKINIIGHTDNTGTPERNLTLSQRRADRIRDFLLSRIDHKGAIYSTRGLGETVPIVSNATQEGRAQNRRVEIMIEGY